MSDHLWVGANHISKKITEENKHKSFRLRSHQHLVPPPSLIPMLEEAGFGEVVKIRHCVLDQHLCTALVERWRPETHTFHLPSGECTVTLEDVSMLLNLKIDGAAVTGSTSNNVLLEYSHWLGFQPEEIRRDGNTIYISWLKKVLSTMPEETTPEIRLQYFRVYLLHFIGSFLMPDSSSNRVSVKYLPLLRDPETVRQYSWGSTCLAALYRGLCVVADTSAKSKEVNGITGCGFLLQAWAQFRIKCFARLRILEVYDGPYALE
ncbi:hypothetical protein TSUD_343240 [Trifolium subterraneum]|nr:hypothetical protein TSUD_343240 [Trifolium subterraneum]